MKIIFLEAVQTYGGAQIATLDLAARLSEQHEVLLVDCYGSCQPFIESVHKRKLSIHILSPREEPFIIFKYSCLWRNLKNILKYIPHWIKLRNQVGKYFRNIQPDLVIVYNTKALSLLRKNSKYKSIYYAHSWCIPSQISRLTKFCLQHRVNKILCISEATGQALYAGSIASLNNMYVVHNAIDEDALPKAVANISTSPGAFKILHSGAFIPDKGIHISVEIARILKEQNFNFQLIITGLIYPSDASEKYYDEINKMISEYGLEEQITIIHNKPNVIDYFRACDVLIHPSATEGFGLVIMEAMILKKPVIVNAVGGVTDMVLHNYTGFIPHYNDIKEYAGYIIELQKKPLLYNSIAKNAYDLIRNNFNEKEQLKAFNRLLNNL